MFSIFALLLVYVLENQADLRTPNNIVSYPTTTLCEEEIVLVVVGVTSGVVFINFVETMSEFSRSVLVLRLS